MQQEILDLVSARKGHFLLESAHHGDLWLDLELLSLQPRRLCKLAVELAARLAAHGPEMICGPLVEGAFVGLLIASELNVPFCYSERFARPVHDGLFPVGYRIPAALRGEIRNKRVALVNDVTNAGSAVIGTAEDLQANGASIVALGSLLVLGSAIFAFAAQRRTPVECLAAVQNNLWREAACPLCTSGVPLEDIGGFRAASANDCKTTFGEPNERLVE